MNSQSPVVKLNSRGDEFNFLASLLETEGFTFMPDSGEPTVRIGDFFVSDRGGKLVSFEEGTEGPIFLNGWVTGWGNGGPQYRVSGIRVSKWTFNEVIGEGPKIYIGGDHMHYALETPRFDYVDLHSPIHAKVESLFWLTNQVIEAEGELNFEDFKAQNGPELQKVKDNFSFIARKVGEYLEPQEMSTPFWADLMNDMTGDGGASGVHGGDGGDGEID